LGELEMVDEQVENAIKDEKPPGIKEECAYSDAVRRFFAKIKALRSRGFSFVQICKAYEKIGQLPRHSNPYSFRQAFLRESSRRTQDEELLKAVKDIPHELGKETLPPPTSATPVAKAEKNNAEEAGINDELAGKKWIENMTSSTVNTGLGKLTKHANGSFDFDWNDT
jgi:hypothetical protein